MPSEKTLLQLCDRVKFRYGNQFESNILSSFVEYASVWKQCHDVQ